VGGDSAGGNLAAVTVAESAHGQGSAVDFQFLLYPVTDSDFHRPSYQACAQAFPMGRADLEHCFARYLPAGVDPASPRVAPMRAEVLRGLPPALVAVAGHDPLHDEGVAYAERLRHEGVEVTMLDYPHLCHGFLRFTGASAGCRTAQTEIVTAARSLADTARPQ
jgi:acetyl esterase